MSIIQLIHDEFKSLSKTFPIAVVCDSITTPENLGMILRVSEAFGVSRVVLNGDCQNANHKKVKRTSRSAENNLQVIQISSNTDICNSLKQEGFTLIGLEITNNSSPVREFNFGQFEKIALVVGSERYGISPEVLTKLNFCVEIPMYGTNSSLNVVNALSIGVYEVSCQLNSLVD